MKNRQETAGWQYKPDGNSPDKGADARDMPEDQSEASVSSSKAHTIRWTASEYIDHKQGTGWYISLAILTAAASVGVYFLANDLFAAIITILVGVIVGVFAHRTPRELTYELSTDGLQIGPKNYPLKLFKSYSIVQDGALLSLGLMPIKKFMPPLSIYFAPTDHEAIMAILEDSLPYEDRALEPIERLTRRLRF